MTVKQIAEITNIDEPTIRARIKKLRLKKRIRNKLHHYPKSAIEQIKALDGRLSRKDRINVVRYWIVNNKPSIKELAYDLSLSYRVVMHIIKDYKENDCIIIKSKMNKL